MLTWTRFTGLCFLVLILIINVPTLYVEAFYVQRVFIHVQRQRTWREAQHFCRKHYTDLATLRSKMDSQIYANNCKISALCWIGLRRDKDDPDVWNWSGGEKTNFTNWDPNAPEPNNYQGNENCAVMAKGFWFDVPCSDQYAFLCYEDLILVKENKTWEDALEHCRTLDTNLNPHSDHSNFNHMYDLPNINNKMKPYAKMMIQEAQTDEVWTGLRFLAGEWLWVNGKPMWYKTLPACPAHGKNCGTMPKTGVWAIKNCEERRNFLCSKRQ